MSINSEKDFFSTWVERITRDLSPFIDPGTTLESEIVGRSLVCRWHQRSRPLTASFEIGMQTGIRVNFDNKVMDYKAFLASPDISDLRSLARMIIQSHKESVFVEPQAASSQMVDGVSTMVHGQALTVIGGLLNTYDFSTNLVVVTADAGSGKTSVLQEMVKRNATQFYNGQVEYILLYINAQGRALARFHEALSTQLNDLRSTLPHHAIASLTRNGLVIPVIDGFDELLGVSGYDDAFSSLAAFIEELDGNGCIVASARSTYYENEFIARANTASGLGAQIWKQSPVKLLGWSEVEYEKYIAAFSENRGLDPEVLQLLKGELGRIFSGKNTPLKNKPLFVVKITQMIVDDEGGDPINVDNGILQGIIQFYLGREVGKLKRQDKVVISSDQLAVLLEDVAEEMWNQETQELDRASVKDVAEYSVSGMNLDAKMQEVVVQKLPSMAFLTNGVRPGSLCFEHETFFGFFFAKKLADLLTSGTTLVARNAILGRSILPSDVYTEVAILVRNRTNSHEDVRAVTASICEASSYQTARTAIVRENAGSILAGIVLGASLEGIKFRGVTFPEVDFGVTSLLKCQLEDVEFRGTNLSRSQFRECETQYLTLYEVLVSNRFTTLDLRGLDVENNVIGIRLEEDGINNVKYDPQEVEAVLISVGAVQAADQHSMGYRKVSVSHKALLDKFVRAYSRTNPICVDDDNLVNIFRNQDWPDLQDMLIESGVVAVEVKHASGSPKTFLRRQVLQPEIAKGATLGASVPVSVKQFWEMFEQRFPEV